MRTPMLPALRSALRPVAKRLTQAGAGVALWSPASIEGGYWLSAQFGVSQSGGFVTSWGSQGELAPLYMARSGSALTVDRDGVYFPGANADFLYESSPVAKTNDHTIFGVIRPKQLFTADGVVIGRYKTSTNERGWQVAFTSSTSKAQAAHSSDGTAVAAVSNDVSPIDQLRNRFFAFVVRKSGTSVKTYWRTALVADATIASATIFDAPLPTTIGARGGTSAADGSIGWNGWIKHIGFYNRAVSDAELAQLIEWLAVEEAGLYRGSAFALAGSAYGSLTSSHATVINANGSTPAQATPETHRYRHHVSVGYLGGRTWIAHSSGSENEDSSGQQLHVESSTDNGATWSAPTVVVDSIGTFGGTAYASGAFIAFSRCFVQHDSKLYLVGAIDKCGATSTDSNSLTGAALVACECKADGTIGTLFRIDTDGPGYSGAPAYDGTLGPTLYTIANREGIWGGNAITPDAGGGSWSGWVVQRDESNTHLTEMTAVRLSGITWLRLLRCTRVLGSTSDGATQRWWSSYSYDDGATWSSPTPTDIGNGPSSGKLLRLADGRFALVSNPVYASTADADFREELSLMLFDSRRKGSAAYIVRDGLGTSPTYAGEYKLGGPAYPGAVQVGGELFVGYSVFKERVDFTRLTLP